MPQLTHVEREQALLERMITESCHASHGTTDALCLDCAALLAYAIQHLTNCRYGDDKPACRQCTTHCYRPAERERIRAVMRFAGPRLLLRGDLDAVGHLFHGLRKPPNKPDTK